MLVAPVAVAAVHDTTEYTLSYTETAGVSGVSVGVSGISSWGSFGPPDSLFFRWALEDQASSIQFGAGTDTRTVLLPDFTLTAKAGYQFTNLGFSTAGTYAVFASDPNTAAGSAAFSGLISPSTQMGDSVSVSAPPSSGGLWNIDTLATVPTYTSLTFSDGSLVLTSVVTGVGASSMIVFDPSNAPGFYFQVTAVPEASEWAMMLAGLGVVGLVARRRRALAT